MPLTSAFDAWLASIASCVSNSARSIVAPSPVCSRRYSAARIALAVYIPENRSATATPDLHRPAARLAIGHAGQAHQPAHALDDIVITGARSVGAVLAEAGDRGVDQTRMGGAQAFGIQPEFLQATDLEILDQHVGIRRHPPNQRRALFGREIDRDRALAAVGREEIGRDLLVAMFVPRRPPMAGVVARAGLLDLDDVRAEVGEQLRRPGPRQHPAEIEDPDARERLSCNAPLEEPRPHVGQDRLRGVMARRAGDAAAGMRSRSAQVKARQRHAVIGRADHRPGAEQLVEPHLAMENVAADQPEPALKIERRMDLPGDDRLGEARRMAIDRGDDRVRRILALVVPRAAIGQLVAEMLAEQRRDMLALGREAGSSVEGISISITGCDDQPLSAASAWARCI